MYIKRVIAVLLLIITVPLVFSFTSCGDEGKPVKVKVIDGDKTVTAKGKDGMTVDKLLEIAKVKVDSRDEVNPNRDTTWRDVHGDSITIKRYAKVTVVRDDEKKEVEMLGGTVELAIDASGLAAEDYSTTLDNEAPLTDGMTIKLEKLANGFNEVGGKTYYFVKGQKQTNAVVGDDEEGYFYAGEDGVIDKGYCNAVTYKDEDWNVINGVATKVESESSTTLNHALKAVSQYITSDMTKEERLRTAFDHIFNDYLEGVRHDPPYYEMDWPVVYANDILVYGKGDCYSYGAAFAYMAKAIGCDEVYACNSGGHGWAEVEGLVYDPEWSMHGSQEFFAVSYDDDTEVPYKFGLQGGADWKRIEITTD